MGSEVGHNGGSSSHSSSSRLLNLLMLQAEAGAVSPEPKLLPAAQAADCTPNPLLQQEQAALLSWRRHAWHAGEQRQPELLHRLLSSGWDEEQAAAGAAGAAASAALLTSSGMASRPGKGGTFGRLLAIIAALAVAVLLLHAAHSDAAHRKLTEPRTGLAVYVSSPEVAEQLSAAQRLPRRRLRLRRLVLLIEWE
ncbi:ABC transporter [Chlorella sorokiniana]|uniref:ABC transporter n=1 Tax=Chlorella sorokiniana TaxID=3076 RepID=A0A2P6TKI8_CHLSO|nr:ABC transporter [Chlorella sorokiniana]|eukprot:PRW44600.1 ABC transporter [Chlorella sorokiniana]